MKTRKRERIKARRDRFVVGYLARGNGVWSAARPNAIDDTYTYIDRLMTREQAEKRLAIMPSSDCAIFELVPIKVNR